MKRGSSTDPSKSPKPAAAKSRWGAGLSPVYRAGWLGARCLFSTYFRWRIWQAERVPLKGPAILASNHASYLDPFLIGAAVPREINYMARESLFRFPGIGALLRKWNAVPVDRDGGGAAGLKAILSRLLAGGVIILFPEGTRSWDGPLQPARSGIGLIVLKSTAPVIPVRVFGTYEAYGRRLKVPRPYRVGITFGPAMSFKEHRAESRKCPKPRLKTLYQQVADEIMDAIAKLTPPPGPT